MNYAKLNLFNSIFWNISFFSSFFLLISGVLFIGLSDSFSDDVKINSLIENIGWVFVLGGESLIGLDVVVFSIKIRELQKLQPSYKKPKDGVVE